MNNAWGIKLGSYGSCVEFCENHNGGIVGVGWEDIDFKEIRNQSRDHIRQYIKSVYKGDCSIGSDTGQLNRFINEINIGDLICYYNPKNKKITIAIIKSESKFRNFDLDCNIDIWHYREIEYPKKIPILDLYGDILGPIIIPRMSVWSLKPYYESIKIVHEGKDPGICFAPDEEIKETIKNLKALIKKRLLILSFRDWETLCAEYFRSEGAKIEGPIGGSKPIIEFEAHFSGNFVEKKIWRVQVKAQKNKTDKSELERYYEIIGEGGNLCFISVNGFTDDAKIYADDNNLKLMEAEDFSFYVLNHTLSKELSKKLKIPTLNKFS